MNPVQETVLLYYPKKPKYLPKIKSIFVQLGIQFRILDAASTAQKIGYLTGRTGFEKSTSDVPFSKIPQSVLVMDHFSGVRMDVLFSYLKKAGIPSIDLKAIRTTRPPSIDSPAPRFAVTVVFPTPPFPEVTTIISLITHSSINLFKSNL